MTSFLLYGTYSQFLFFFTICESQPMSFVIKSLTNQIQVDWVITWTGADDLHLENVTLCLYIRLTLFVFTGSFYDVTTH